MRKKKIFLKAGDYGKLYNKMPVPSLWHSVLKSQVELKDDKRTVTQIVSKLLTNKQRLYAAKDM